MCNSDPENIHCLKKMSENLDSLSFFFDKDDVIAYLHDSDTNYVFRFKRRESVDFGGHAGEIQERYRSKYEG